MSPKTIPLRHGHFGEGSVEVEPAKPGEGPVRRLAITSKELLTKPMEGIETIPDILAHAAKKYGNMNAAGWRNVVKEHEEQKEIKKTVDGHEVTETKKWTYYELSDYKYMDYLSLETAVSQAARGLAVMGVRADQVFNIYASTGLNWQIISQGCALISSTVATAYDTLGEAGLEHSINEPEAVGIFVSCDLIHMVGSVIRRTPSLRYIIYDGKPRSGVLERLYSVNRDIKALHIDDLLKVGKASDMKVIAERYPKPDTVACIMYTSGSTGPPKGVCLTHANLIASVASVHHVFDRHLPSGDRYLAYLPLAHVLEYVIELVALYVGITIGYARPKTLTDSSVRNCKGDLVTFQPTIVFGVPAVWETIKKGIITKVNSSNIIAQKVFWGALAIKKAEIPILSRVANSLVLGPIRAATGGQLRLGMSGGASLSRDTQDFLSHTLTPLVQAYGMTETCAMCTLLPPELHQIGSVGLPVPSMEIKLMDVPEAGYSSQNDPPTGEVCIRGPSVTKGYYKRPDLNSDESIFAKDGWFRTGDVGRWNPDGTISLIDRIKNLIKLQHGEYIALEHLEAIYKSCDLISNICVYASAEAKQPVAIIIPHEHNLRRIHTTKASLHDLCQDKAVKETVLKECNALGKKNGLRPVELLCDVILTSEEWTPENGLLTAAHKIQRSKIANAFKSEIDAVYQNQG